MTQEILRCVAFSYPWLWQKGFSPALITFPGAHAVVSRNNLAASALEKGAEWLMWIDDDSCPPMKMVSHLLSGALDTGHKWVVPLFTMKYPPYTPCVYESKGEDGKYISALNAYMREPGLYRARAAGFHCMLMHRSVLEAVRNARTGKYLFHCSEDGLQEDLRFCDDAHEAGCELWLDSTFEVGHQTTVAKGMKDFHGWLHENARQNAPDS